MATGILSVGLGLLGYEGVSRVLLGVAGVAWLVLAAAFVNRFVGERTHWEADADTPAALTAVAATTVLGTRFTGLGWRPLGAALLALAVVLWPVLLTFVLRHLGRRMPGVVFLVCVATEGIAVLAGTLAAAWPAPWLARAALVFFVLGFALYAAVFPRFGLHYVRDGAGDQWVAGGALAISALAGAKLVGAKLAGTELVGPAIFEGAAHDVLRTVTLVVLALDLTWYAVLLCAELRWPRPHYDVRRWATVFPMGMTAVATLSVATAAQVPWLTRPGQVLLWIALAAWLLTLAGLLRRAARAPRPGPRS
ncbi:tellurite resistance/C4-dicarboxylate transporter family protein [Streptomyces sp. NPDC059009]|uniref:tellurite resistance/C4-dicarboxylate transporter family protein n=1 Tax=Streptomyces sp. NPDC059009 TaxID=3346694 RepID=UPI0036AD4CE9